MKIVGRIGAWVAPLLSRAKRVVNDMDEAPFAPRVVTHDRWGYARYALANAGCLAGADGQFPEASSTDLLDDFTVLFAARNCAGLTHYTDFLTGAGMAVFCRDSVSAAIDAVIAAPEGWGLLVLCLEDSQFSKPTIAKLRVLRRKAPGVRVLLLASDVKADAYAATGALAFVDAIVRTPALLSRFEIGVVAALTATRPVDTDDAEPSSAPGLSVWRDTAARSL